MSICYFLKRLPQALVLGVSGAGVPMIYSFFLVVPPASLQAADFTTNLIAVSLCCNFSRVSFTVVLPCKYFTIVMKNPCGFTARRTRQQLTHSPPPIIPKQQGRWRSCCIPPMIRMESVFLFSGFSGTTSLEFTLKRPEVYILFFNNYPD